MLLLLAAIAANAAGLDLIEVGGPWASPGLGGPGAVWFNPAGLAYREGSTLLAEVAPARGYVSFDRDDPHNGGLDLLQGGGVVPFGGVSSDLGVKGLGVGLAVFAPYGKAGRSANQQGSASYAVRSGAITNVYVAPGVAYRHESGFIVGGAVHGIASFYKATTDKEVLTALDAELCNQGQCGQYDDSQIEDPDYGALVELDLSGISAGFTVGAAFEPNEHAGFGFSYVHGASIRNGGQATLDFSCPPDDDVYGRFGSQLTGICDVEIPAVAEVRFQLPHRYVGFARVSPTGDRDELSFEVYGGLTQWSRYQTVDVTTVVDPDRVALDREEDRQATANLLGQDLTMARGFSDTVWIAGDVRGRVNEKLSLGTRVTFDRHAIPDGHLSPNNFDTDTLIAAVFGQLRVSERVTLGGSFSHSFQQTRVQEDTVFRVTLDPDNQAPDGYRLPSMNGTYRGAIDRGGVMLMAEF